MKLFSLVILLSFISCNDPVRSSRSTISPVTQPTTAPTMQPQESKQGDLSDFTSKGIVHLNPKVKIDNERQEIEIMEANGLSAKFCNIDLNAGDVLRYHMINNYELEVYMRNETLKMKRVHKTETGIYGDWQETKYTARDSERIVTFFIRNDEIMYVDVYCEQKSGIEEF